jgi:hypothetical protein
LIVDSRIQDIATATLRKARKVTPCRNAQGCIDPPAAE